MENYTVVNNNQLLRFEIELNGEFAYLDYKWNEGSIALMHTEVPDEMQGKGIASVLAKEALEYAKKQQLKILLYCPYVAKYVKEHAEYAALIDKQYQ